MSCIRPLVIYQVKIPLVWINCRLALQPETWADGDLFEDFHLRLFLTESQSNGVCVTLRAHVRFERRHSSSQQLNACSTIHGVL